MKTSDVEVDWLSGLCDTDLGPIPCGGLVKGNKLIDRLKSYRETPLLCFALEFHDSADRNEIWKWGQKTTRTSRFFCTPLLRSWRPLWPTHFLHAAPTLKRCLHDLSIFIGYSTLNHLYYYVGSFLDVEEIFPVLRWLIKIFSLKGKLVCLRLSCAC